MVTNTVLTALSAAETLASTPKNKTQTPST